MRIAYNPKEISEEIKLFTLGRISIYAKDIMSIAVMVGIYWALSGLVNAWLMVPYILLAAVTSFYLIRPARLTNPGKRNWEAIILLVIKSRSTVYSLNPQKTVGLDILKSLPVTRVEKEAPDYEHSHNFK